MNKIEQLLEKYCPDGVEFKELGEVCGFKNGFSFKSTKFRENGAGIIRITNIKNKYIDTNNLVFFDENDYKENLQSYKLNKGDILVAMSGATTGKIGILETDYDCYLNQRVGKFVPDIEVLDNQFLYHFLLSKINEIYYIAGGGAQLNLSSVKLMKTLIIPIPPIDVQQEIVKILDTFTQLEAELEAELEARKKQYEYYRDDLLSFGDDEVEWKSLGEVLDYEQPTKYLVSSTNYDDLYMTPVLTAGQTFILGYTDEVDGIFKASKENPVIIFDDFTTAFKWVDFDFKAKSSAMKMLTSKNTEEYNLQYVFYAMNCLTYSPQDHARQWIQTYSKIKIPLPSLEKQQEIVAILDKFDALVNDISIGLPAELKARRQQYEYYRGKLLTFKELEK